MIQKVNQKNSQSIFPTGCKILCDGYVIIRAFLKVKTLIFNHFLCDGYVIIGELTKYLSCPQINTPLTAKKSFVAFFY